MEVGAGHGPFTEAMLEVGASVTITEMSGPSARMLRQLYGNNKNVEVIHDIDGRWLDTSEQTFDLVACISVLHHVPDYLSFLQTAFEHTNNEGSFISWQDPLWYPNRSFVNLNFEKISYFGWRITQGKLFDGFKTRVRRLRGVIDESNPADMVEYHVVRDGMNEERILALCDQYFEESNIQTYWSTQNSAMQFMEKFNWIDNSFGIEALGRIEVKD